MSGLVVAFVAGMGVGAWLFYRVGVAHARAKRAWADLVSTKNSIRYLWGRAREEVGKAVRYGLIALGVLAGAGWLLWTAVTR